MTVFDISEFRKNDNKIDAALIGFGDVSICYAVCNLSDGAAALDVGEQPGIPDQFTLLVFSKKRGLIRVNVMWRKGRRIGVSFR
jgi:hypothetical protein